MGRKRELEIIAEITLGETVCTTIGYHRQVIDHVIEDIFSEPNGDTCLLSFADGGSAQVKKEDLYEFTQGKLVKNPVNGDWLLLRKED